MGMSTMDIDEAEKLVPDTSKLSVGQRYPLKDGSTLIKGSGRLWYVESPVVAQPQYRYIDIDDGNLTPTFVGWATSILIGLFGVIALFAIIKNCAGGG